MAKPTPIPTAQRALATAIKALESISISTGIKGTAIKLGNEFVTDTNAVLNDLRAVTEDAQTLVDGLTTMLNKLAETANTERLEALIKEDHLNFGDPSVNGKPVSCFASTFESTTEEVITEDSNIAHDHSKFLTDAEESITPSEFVEAELNSTVPIERTTAPELFAASPSF